MPPSAPAFFSDNKLDTNRTQTEHSANAILKNRTQTEHATEHKNGHKPHTNRTQSGYKVDTQPDTSPASSSFYNKSKRTTTSENNYGFKLSEEWQAINIEALIDIGFTQTHLIQLAQQNKLTPNIIQTSINAFAYDLKQQLTVQLDRGDILTFNISDYPHLTYGYAATIHKLQGETVDKSFVLATHFFIRNRLIRRYCLLSSHKSFPKQIHH